MRPGQKRAVTWRRKDLQLHRRGVKLKVLRRRLNYIDLDGEGGLGDALRMVVNTTLKSVTKREGKNSIKNCYVIVQ